MLKPLLPEPRLFFVEEYYRMSDLGILDPDQRTEFLEGEVVLMAAKNRNSRRNKTNNRPMLGTTKKQSSNKKPRSYSAV